MKTSNTTNLTIKIETYEENTDHEFRCLNIYNGKNSLATYQESGLFYGNWGYEPGQEENDEFLFALGYDNDDADTHDVAREREQAFVECLTALLNMNN